VGGDKHTAMATAHTVGERGIMGIAKERTTSVTLAFRNASAEGYASGGSFFTHTIWCNGGGSGHCVPHATLFSVYVSSDASVGGELGGRPASAAGHTSLGGNARPGSARPVSRSRPPGPPPTNHDRSGGHKRESSFIEEAARAACPYLHVHHRCGVVVLDGVEQVPACTATAAAAAT
jgi:hypothetical protein